ncbi:serine/threonine-protein kinase [Microbispora hainanensis]|uniref:serine/threonine-protein kinase n=1 Tax=Microbispora hainanensis TaxID=568844 RepID=UPI0033D919AC
MVPSTLGGRYELEELIGQGGMGEVWRGRDLRAHRPVAVKILTPQISGVASRERFAREARAAARVVHPNVVTVLDVGEQDARPYLVMELLTGRSLAAELLDRGRYGVAEACHLMSQAAAGLDAAHRAGVVHRDVKPANLHLTESGVLKVVDFGVAQVATEAARLTMVGTVVGTAAYLAPEQIDGRGGGSACDLYALGCVCYELLCGHPPFTGSAPELVYQHIHQAPAPPGRHRPDIPAELERLIMALLAKDPAARPADAEVARRILAAVALSAARPAWEAGTPAPPPAPYAGGARAGDTALLDTPLLDTPLLDTPLLDTPPPGVTPPAAPAGRAAGMSPERRTLLRLGAAVAGLAVVTIGVAALSDGGGPAEPAVAAPSPEATPTGTSPTPRKVSPSPARATRTPSPRPSPKPSPKPSPTPPARPVYRNYQEWLAAFEHAVREQERRGGIEPRLARDAHEAIRKTARDMSPGRGRGRGGDRSDKAARRVRDILIKLRQARQAGRIADGPLVDFLNTTGISGR